ncbi:copper chaperone PCu(A)C [Streptomyces sp. ISL-10]|uniref:copper chaperone PCu(A)C n=1 Tax=Streptomyces sp. ISL-10 TaxID=2819172 RepID=UPI001BE9C989|nr:copper chaperone PCu(A)C [Streptomyces sp. ISL-10]MBT2367283.1 copper chaperone PCu(A)C [Streptomyces sp. ISL-10]
MLFRRFVTAARAAAAGAVFGAVALTAGCGSGEGFDPDQWNAPGQNAKVGSVLIRYAHIAEPQGQPWKEGDDVPAYMWLYNKGPEADRLVSASTPAARSVEIVDAGGDPLPQGVTLPADELQELEPGRTHLVLRDLRQVVRGGDFVKLAVRFEKSGATTFNVHSQIPVYDQSPSPDR